MQNQLSFINKRIDATNADFISASSAKKAVMLAQDVIQRIKSNSFLITTDKIFYPSTSFEYDNNDSLKYAIENNLLTNCSVDIKGAFFIALIAREGDMSIREFYLTNSLNSQPQFTNQKFLLDIFTIYQLDLIETAFNGRSFIGKVDTESANKAIEFYNEHVNKNSTDADRLIDICNNIILNKGIFIL